MIQGEQPDILRRQLFQNICRASQLEGNMFSESERGMHCHYCSTILVHQRKSNVYVIIYILRNIEKLLVCMNETRDQVQLPLLSLHRESILFVSNLSTLLYLQIFPSKS